MSFIFLHAITVVSVIVGKLPSGVLFIFTVFLLSVHEDIGADLMTEILGWP